jgi:hypothetical protein
MSLSKSKIEYHIKFLKRGKKFDEKNTLTAAKGEWQKTS